MRAFAPFALGLLLLTAACSGDAGPAAETGDDPAPPPDGVWTLAERRLPPPAAVSDALRAAIEAGSQPDLAAAREGAPATLEEWSEAIAERREGADEVLATLSEAFSVTVDEDAIAGVPVYRATPDDVHPDHRDRLFVHLHGGAYVFGGGPAAAFEAVVIAGRARIPALSIDYRMPPDHPFPAAVDDVVAVWKDLVAERPARTMALGGTSAGGGLALAATHRFKDLGLEVPGAIWAGTPWADLTKTGDSQFANEGIDRILVSYDGLLEGAARLYAGDHDLRSPLLSPVYGDFASFPPTSLVSGTRDLFLSDVVRVHRKLRAAGAVADLHVYEGSSHADYALLLRSPESEEVYRELGAFLLRHLE